ncbi:MAG: quinoprotein relay system zinc metallohydrolase 2 [Gammaproteobacteria bacterium]|nr:quinoprotein relay system zinc metallohydrolase 2 [Gammaproteobacteria bacterium]
MNNLLVFKLLFLVSFVLLRSESLWAKEDVSKEIAPGIYLRQGIQQDVSIQNQGHIANIGFVVGDERVAVIDTGSSYQGGLALRKMIREITSLPIDYVILTHMHPDHVLGASAFSQDGPVYVGHVKLADALVRRQSFYLARAKDVLGSLAEGTRILLPSEAVDVNRQMELDLGGRILELQAYPTAHTNNDLSVYDRKTGTLWLSDLLFVERTPVIDGSLLGWLKVMDGLKELEPERVVPGHGPVVTDWKKALADQRRYFEVLATGIREIIAGNGTIKQAVAVVGQDEKGNWLLFDAYHGRNVTASFVELEWE